MTDKTQAEMWDLIPWYVNGTLDPQEHRAVEAEMAQDDDFAAEVALQRRMQRAVADIDVATQQTEHSWSHLEAQLSPRRRWSWPSLPSFQLVLAPTALAAVIAVGVLGVVQPWSPTEFETLTTEDPSAITAQANLRISPAPDADPARVQDALRAAGVQQVGPVSETGLIYGYADAARLQAVAEALQNDPAISFVAGDF